jgi:hypothetical protein
MNLMRMGPGQMCPSACVPYVLGVRYWHWLDSVLALAFRNLALGRPCTGFGGFLHRRASPCWVFAIADPDVPVPELDGSS